MYYEEQLQELLKAIEHALWIMNSCDVFGVGYEVAGCVEFLNEQHREHNDPK